MGRHDKRNSMQRYRHRTACEYGEVAAEPLRGLHICDLPKLAARAAT